MPARPVLVCQANWQKARGASPPERRSNQTTFLREPCVGSREGAGEASAAVRMGRAMEHRKSDGPGCRGFQIGRRQHRRHRFGEMSAGPAVSENPCTFARLFAGTLGASMFPGKVFVRVRDGISRVCPHAVWRSVSLCLCPVTGKTSGSWSREHELVAAPCAR